MHLFQSNSRPTQRQFFCIYQSCLSASRLPEGDLLGLEEPAVESDTDSVLGEGERQAGDGQAATMPAGEGGDVRHTTEVGDPLYQDWFD